MKKKNIMLACIAVAIAVLAEINLFKSHSNEMPNLLIQNIEALADNDKGQGNQRYVLRDCTITKYKYDKDGRVIEEKTYTTHCCEAGSFGLPTCDYPPC